MMLAIPRRSEWFGVVVAVVLGTLASGCARKAPAVDGDAVPGARYICLIDHFTGTAPDCQLDSEAATPANKGGMNMWEVTRYLDIDPTPEQERAAQDLIDACFASAEANGWYDFEKATADGYAMKASGDPVHFTNNEFLLDDRILDPEHPEVLMFYDTPRGKKLVGFMFLPRHILDEGPQVAGPLTRWHFHTWWGPLCFSDDIVDAGLAVDDVCPEGSRPSIRSPEMMHVWLVNHPQGPFTGMMMLKPDVLEKLLIERGDY